MYKPVRIRAYMQTGIISDQFLPLDGVIYYHVVRNTFGERTITKPMRQVFETQSKISLPFAIENPSTEKFFHKCSFAVWSADTIEDQQTYSKRFDLKYSDIIDFKGRAGKVDMASGRTKNYHIKVYYRIGTYVEWYAVAEIKELKHILKFVTNLGKKTAQGWGSILKWEIEEWKDDWSIYGFKEKRLMRAVPSSEGFVYGIRPSYWDPHNQFPCYLPGLLKS